MTRFINSVEDISSENMQKLWGKILAGEILEPSTFSYKTLECMRNLSKKDAELFERLCKTVIEDSFIISDLNILKNWGFLFLQCMVLKKSSVHIYVSLILFH